MRKVSRITDSPKETMALAKAFAKNLQPGDIVLLDGELGAGKTVFAKGIAGALGIKEKEVNSPTFVIMNAYHGKLPLYHFDLYRLEDPQELKSVSFDEYFYGNGISVIEWPQRLGRRIPTDHWLVELKHHGEGKRKICISCPSNLQAKLSL